MCQITKQWDSDNDLLQLLTALCLAVSPAVSQTSAHQCTVNNRNNTYNVQCAMYWEVEQTHVPCFNAGCHQTAPPSLLSLFQMSLLKANLLSLQNFQTDTANEKL